MSLNPVQEITNDPHVTYTGFDQTIVTVANGTLTPVRVGETYGLVTLTDAQGATLETGYVRVHVHTAITRLEIANRMITLRAGSADYIPSVYAAFDGGPIVDITGHAYVTISAAPNAPFTVAPNDPLGRLHAAANATGIGTVIAQAGGLNVFASVMIAPALTTERRIVERVRYQGDHDNHRNILFLADGYPNKAVFDRHVRELSDRIFTSPMYSPFPQLAHRFNVWSAFELWGLGDAGITITTPVTSDGYAYPFQVQSDLQHYAPGELTLIVGLPGAQPPTTVVDAKQAWATTPGFNAAMLDETALNGWLKHATLEPLAPKDSQFGACFGQRSGGPMASPVRTGLGPVGAQGHWELLPALDSRTMTIDFRRLPEDPQFPGQYNPDFIGPVNEFFQQYLEALKYGSDPDHADFHVGRVWSNTGADEGMIVLLVYDELFGGTTLGVTENGHHHRVAIVFPVGDAKGVSLVSGATPRDHIPQVDSINKDRTATKIVHEIGHALGLLDEYENTDGTGGIDAAQAPIASVEEGGNTMHVSNVIDPQTHFVRADNIKWSWARIAMASEIADVNPAPPTAIDETPVTLVPGQAAKWAAAHAQNLDVYLRSRQINALPANLGVLGPLKIIAITGDVLTLKGPPVSIFSFTKGSVLYMPAMDGVKMRSVLHPAVHDFLMTHPPFGINANPAVVNDAGESPPDIPHLSKPKHRESVIGVYDGAATFNTNAFRPAGNCRMRQTDYWTVNEFRWVLKVIPWYRTVPRVRQFCFVCKYFLVNEIAPEAFDTLDREYPEDC